MASGKGSSKTAKKSSKSSKTTSAKKSSTVGVGSPGSSKALADAINNKVAGGASIGKRSSAGPAVTSSDSDSGSSSRRIGFSTGGPSISDLANSAVNTLNPILDLRTNDLDAYVTQQLRNDYIRDYGTIQDSLNKATNAAYDVTRAQAIQDALKAEDTNYANTRQAISEMRRNLIGSASSGANVGAANATALQALLGLGQQNTQTTTEGLQNINNVGRERAAQLAQNAADAITAANDATSKMYDAATSAYASDRSYAAQGAAEALGNMGNADITSQYNERMNDATNAANKAIAELQAKSQEKVAKTTQKQKISQTVTTKKK